MPLRQDERYYCPKCDRWFPADVISGGMHVVIVLMGKDTHHVVYPEAEALAFLRERK